LIWSFSAYKRDVLEFQVAPQLESSHHTNEKHVNEEHVNEKRPHHTYEEKPKGSKDTIVLAKEISTLQPFDINDTSSWGAVIEKDKYGNATQFLRSLPNGDQQAIVFSHGLSSFDLNGKTSQPDWTTPGSTHLHWNRPNKDIPIVVIDATTKSKWGGYINEAVRKWNKSNRFDIRMGYFTGDNRTEQARIEACKGTKKGFILVCNYSFSISPPKKDAIIEKYGGYAIVKATSDGHIYSVTVHLNDQFYDFDKLGPGQDVRDTREYIVCHELGHALGLGHADVDWSTSDGTCMGYSYDFSSNADPDQHDLEELEKRSLHKHADDIAMGYVCTDVKGTRSTRTYSQRIEYNGMEAIATINLITYSESERKSYKRSVDINTKANNRIFYTWSLPNYNDMAPHAHGKTGNYPRLHSNKVGVFDSSEFMPTDYTLAERLLDAKVHSIIAFPEQLSDESTDETCEVLTEQQLGDVDHFIPPKNGTLTGSYETNEIKKDANGNRIKENGRFVILDDYELAYEYVNKGKGALRNDLIDPDIRPMTISSISVP